MPICLAREAVDDFIQGAVTSAGDDQLPPFVIRALCEFGGIAGSCGLGEIRVNAAGGKNAARFMEHGASAPTAVSGVGVVNQQRVMDFRGHPQFDLGAGSFLAVLILYNVRRN